MLHIKIELEREKNIIIWDATRKKEQSLVASKRVKTMAMKERKDYLEKIMTNWEANNSKEKRKREVDAYD